MPFRYGLKLASVQPGRGTGLDNAMRVQILRAGVRALFGAMSDHIRRRRDPGGGRFPAAKWRKDRPVLAGLTNLSRWSQRWSGFDTVELVFRPSSRANLYKPVDLAAIHTHGANIHAGSSGGLYVPYSDRAYKVTGEEAKRRYLAGSWVMGRIESGHWVGYQYSPEDGMAHQTGDGGYDIDFFVLPHVRLSPRNLHLSDREKVEVAAEVRRQVLAVKRKFALAAYSRE